MSDFQDRAYAESVSFTRGALIGALAGFLLEITVAAAAIWLLS